MKLSIDEDYYYILLLRLTSNAVNTIFSIDPKYRSQRTWVCWRKAKIRSNEIERTTSGT